MKFQNVTLAGIDCGLLLIRPELDAEKGRAFSVAHALDTVVAKGLTTIEERRPKRSKPLLTVKCTLVAHGAQVDDWRKGVAALGNRPVAIPLWIDALPANRWSERIYDAEQVINFDPASDAFAIYARTAVPASPSYPLVAPLFIGRWEKRPTVPARGKKLHEIDLTLVEDSPYSCRIGVNAYGDGWTAAPDWSSAPKETSEHGLETTKLGAARESALDRENSAARWLQEAQFSFADRLEIRRALSAFVAQRGAWQSWSGLPMWMHVGTPTSATPANITARFASDTLTISYRNGASASARVSFLQEVLTPGREQARPAEVYLYRLAYAHDPQHPELFADWDAPITTDVGTFAPHQITSDNLVRSLKPQDIKASLTCAYRAGSLLADWVHGRLFGKLQVTVWKVDPDAVAPVEVWSGEVTNVVPEGTLLKVTAKLFGGILDQQIGGWQYGQTCRTTCFSTLCGLDEATHRSTGTIADTDLSADGCTLTVHGVTGWGGPTYAAQWFASGILRTGTGRQTIRATIIASVMSGGNLVLTFRRPLWADMLSASGQVAQLVPGCQRRYVADCIDKFANGDNFRGEPFMPDYLETVAANTKVGK
jgi:uncharacterized phage protein (TIGR02218 family)